MVSDLSVGAFLVVVLHLHGGGGTQAVGDRGLQSWGGLQHSLGQVGAGEDWGVARLGLGVVGGGSGVHSTTAVGQ